MNIPKISPAKFYSKLDDPQSLVPIAMRDIVNSIGMTTASSITGKEEGQDRFIDEFGTQAIWLWGIPIYKKVIDLTAFKAFNLDSKFDVRNLKNENKDIFEKIQQRANADSANKKVAEHIQKIAKQQKLFKGLSLFKFAASTALTVGSYYALTKYKQRYTEKNVKKSLMKEKEKENNLSFKGKMPAFIENIAFNPVDNMKIVDLAITGNRLSSSRNQQEFIGYFLKESTFLFFMYVASDRIRAYLEKKIKSKFNKSIELNAKVLEDDKFKSAFKNHEIAGDLKTFSALKSKGEIYDFLYDNPENWVVKASKKADIIPLYSKTDKIDPRGYIDIDRVKETAKQIENLYTEFKGGNQTCDEFFNQARKLKRKSIAQNTIACILAMGVLLPGVMLLQRFLSKDTEFGVKKQMRAELGIAS